MSLWTHTQNGMDKKKNCSEFDDDNNNKEDQALEQKIKEFFETIETNSVLIMAYGQKVMYVKMDTPNRPIWMCSSLLWLQEETR